MSFIARRLQEVEVNLQKLKARHYPCYYPLQAALMRPV
jgi:hypothetical protein